MPVPVVHSYANHGISHAVSGHAGGRVTVMAHTTLSGLDLFFLLCAAGGGLLFVIRLILQLITGGGGHDDPSGAFHHHMGDSDIGFKLFTLQGLIIFFIMFGLVGLAMHRASGFGDVTSIIGAFLAGGFCCVTIAALSSAMLKLQSSGNFNPRKAIGCDGSIYAGIPQGGRGQAQVTVENRMRILDAIAEDRQPIRTGERVRVLDVVEGNLLIVRKI